MRIAFHVPPGMLVPTQNSSYDELVERVPTGPESKPDQRSVQGVKVNGTVAVLTLQTMPYPIDDVLDFSGNHAVTLVEKFKTGGGIAEFRALLPPPSPVFQSVLDACRFVPRENGSVTSAFGQQVSPILHDLYALKMKGPTTDADHAALKILEGAAKNQTEIDVVNIIGTVNDFIVTERKPAEVVQRKRCIQAILDQMSGMKFIRPKSCDAMYPDTQ